MTKYVCVGDPPSTGGEILPYTLNPRYIINGHLVARVGGKVYCEACDSVGVIAKAGKVGRVGIGEKGQYETALEGDIVLCECDDPPKLLAVKQSVGKMAEMAGGGPALKFYDEQIRFKNDLGKPIVGMGYVLTLANGKKASGVTDENGLTKRVKTREPVEISKVEFTGKLFHCGCGGKEDE